MNTITPEIVKETLNEKGFNPTDKEITDNLQNIQIGVLDVLKRGYAENTKEAILICVLAE